MNRPTSRSLTLAELASTSGVAARTIRYYIARGLVDGPRGAGRGAAYDDTHVRQLADIGALKRRGLSLQAIRRELGPAPQATLPEPQAWWRYAVADDVRVEIRGDVTPWRMHRIRTLLAELAGHLDETAEDDDNE